MHFDAYDELLQVITSSESPPHEVIVTLFVKFFEWRPREIVTELSRLTLRTLVDEIEAQFLHFHFDPRYVASRLRPLRERLEETVSAAVGRDANTRKAYQRVLSAEPAFGARVVGETTLRDFFAGRDPGTMVVRWRASIARHAVKTYAALGAMKTVGAVALPHWALSFACVRLLGWEPSRVVAKVAGIILADLLHVARSGLGQDKRLADGVARPAFLPLSKRLERSVGDLVGQEEVLGHPHGLDGALEVPRRLFPSTARDTNLANYFTVTDDELQVVLWTIAAGDCADS